MSGLLISFSPAQVQEYRPYGVFRPLATGNKEAYQDYLKGRHWWNKRTEEGINKGIAYFRQAIAKDPNYALAYAGLADCYSLPAAFSFVPPKEVFPRAKEAALKALELDDSLAEAHTSLAYVKAVYDWDWSGGERELQRAIALNPSSADVPQIAPHEHSCAGMPQWRTRPWRHPACFPQPSHFSTA